MPLALVIARYFVYALMATVLVAVATFGTLLALVEGGVVYAANYAESNADAVIGALETGELAPEELPSCYRWAVFDADGSPLASDMSAAEASEARNVLESGESVTHVGLLGSAMLQVKATLPDGGTCVLQYDFVPDFTSRELRDALPDPQSLATALLGILFVAAMALIATRAARVISAKMRPLVLAAAHIERQELDFETGHTNVREVNDVLAAMERMRVALKESLEGRWQAEEAQRAQMAALAHDLKTPLTVVRANAEFLSEEEGLSLDALQAAEAAAEGARRLDAYVRLIIDASRDGGTGAHRERIDAAAWANACETAARRVADAAGVRLEAVRERGFIRRAEAVPLVCDATALERAALNLVANACDHAPKGSTVRLTFACEDARLRAGRATDAKAAPALEDAQTQKTRAWTAEGLMTSADDAGARATDANEKAARTPSARKQSEDGKAGKRTTGEDGALSGAAPMLALTVEDEGAGFTPAALSRGCERFFRDDASRARIGTGRERCDGAIATGGRAGAADGDRKGGADVDRGCGRGSDSAAAGDVKRAEDGASDRACGEGAAKPGSPSAPEASHYGLGLSIASDIAHAHGGCIELANRPCRGARATLRAAWE